MVRAVVEEPPPYQVWRTITGRAVRLIASFQSGQDAAALARADRPAIVFCELEVALRTGISSAGRAWERGRLREPTAVRLKRERLARLSAAPDGTALKSLRMSVAVAKTLAAELGGIELVREGRRFVLRRMVVTEESKRARRSK